MKVTDEMRAVWEKAEGACKRCVAGNHGDCYGGQMVHRPGFYSTGEKVRFKCACKASHHRLFVGICTYDDSGPSPCARPATTRVVVGPGRARHFGGSADHEVERCNLHASVWRRQEKARGARDERSRARRARWDEEERASKAAGDWAQRLRDDFGIDCEAQRAAVVVLAEKLYGQIARADAILRDVVDEAENPFRA